MFLAGDLSNTKKGRVLHRVARLLVGQLGGDGGCVRVYVYVFAHRARASMMDGWTMRGNDGAGFTQDVRVCEFQIPDFKTGVATSSFSCTGFAAVVSGLSSMASSLFFSSAT